MDAEVYDALAEMEDGHWWFRGRRAVLHALLRRAGMPPPGRTLDAGCGTGGNLREFAGPGGIWGIDVSPDAIAYCRARGLGDHVQVADFDPLPFEDDAFTLLLATDVLEHVQDDGQALRELHRVAAPDARLVITVPAYQWLFSDHDRSHHHHRRYTREQIERRARAAGWEPVVSTYFNSVLLAPIAAVRMAERAGVHRSASDYEMTPGPLNTMLEKPMRAEAGLIARGRSLPAGVSIGVVCRP